MPELPEVETLCRMMRRVLVGKEIENVKGNPDTIVFKSQSVDDIETKLLQQKVEEVGRKGKYFWLTFEEGFSLIGHLGMSGWIERLDGNPEDPRYLKLRLEVGPGSGIAITDRRRLGRLWLSDDPENDPAIKKLGPDALTSLPKPSEFSKLVLERKAPIKAILLDQGFVSGIGNYLADEILYSAKIAPMRIAHELSKAECSRIHKAIASIVSIAVGAEADETRFPETWLFHHRWGGKRGSPEIGGQRIVRETIAGRNTAWVPKVQK